jgi:hypothetical protein
MMAGKRQVIAPRGNKRYTRRNKRGQFTEQVDVGRSLAQDRRRRAKHEAAPGQGDKGDRRMRRGPLRATRTSR